MKLYINFLSLLRHTHEDVVCYHCNLVFVYSDKNLYKQSDTYALNITSNYLLLRQFLWIVRYICNQIKIITTHHITVGLLIQRMR